MRVTGSIMIFCRGMVYPNFAAGLGMRPSSSSLSTEKIRSADGGQPGTKTSTGTTSCTGRAMGSSGGIDFARNLRVERGVLQVGAPQDGVDAEVVAHGGHVAGDGAIAQRDQNLGARADQPDAVQILLARNGAFHQRHIDVLGKLLGIHQRAPDHLDALRQRRSGARPCRAATCGSRSSHPARRWRAGSWERLAVIGVPPASASGRAGTAGAWTFRRPIFLSRKARPVGQTCTHLPQPVQLSRVAPGLGQVGDHAALGAARHHVPGVRAFDLVAHPHAAGAQDAAVVVHHEALVRGVHRQAADTDRESGRGSCPASAPAIADRSGRW